MICDVCQEEKEEIRECSNCNESQVCPECDDTDEHIWLCNSCEKQNCVNCCTKCTLCDKEYCHHCLKNCCKTCVTCECYCNKKYFKICKLHADLQCYILQFLAMRDISQITQTSKHFQVCAKKEDVWKSLLKRQQYFGISVPYEICRIENLSFRETYKDIKTGISISYIQSIIRTYDKFSVASLPYYVTLVCKGVIREISTMLEIMLFAEMKDMKKFEEYLTLFQPFIGFRLVGKIYDKIFKNYETALDFFSQGIRKNIESEECFLEGLKLINIVKTNHSIISWCKLGLKYFPSYKYAVLYTIAKESNNLELALESLSQFDNRMNHQKPSIFNNIKQYHILRLIGICYFKNRQYSQALEYWKKILRLNPISSVFVWAVHSDLIIMLIQNMENIHEAQEYISNVHTRITLSPPQYHKLSIWQAKCMEYYLNTKQWEKIQRYSQHFQNIVEISQSFALKSFVNECRSIASFHQSNFKDCLSSILKCDKSNNRMTRYIGKCLVKLRRFEEAFEYFTKYMEQKRNSVILLEFALLYSESDSYYFNLEIAEQFYLEAREKQNKKTINNLSLFDELELFRQMEFRLYNKKRKRENVKEET